MGYRVPSTLSSVSNRDTPSTGTFFGGDVDAPFTGSTDNGGGVFGTPIFVDHTNVGQITDKKGLNKYKPGSSDNGLGVEVVDEAFGWSESKKDKERKRKEQEERDALQAFMAGQLPKYAQADTDYANTYSQNTANIKKLMDEYLATFEKTLKGSIDSSTQARDSYTDSWLGKDMDGDGIRDGGTQAQMQANADSAMTIDEFGDPDNKVAMAYRESYERDAQQARQQGQRDYGILAAMGAQAAQGQFGMSGPMTAGAMGQIYAQNQNQAGQAYAKAQQRMYDLQQQGRKAGEVQSENAYKYGQAAIQDLIKGNQGYSSSTNASNTSIGNLANVLNVGQNATQQYYTDREDSLAGINHMNTTNQLNREGGLETGNFDWLTQMLSRDQNKEDRAEAQKLEILKTILGAMAGGMGGAAAGAAA
jgi:hypothetical protein